MRKSILCFLAFCITVPALSQWSAGAGATYTYLMGDYKKGSPGFQSLIQYDKGAYGIRLAYNYLFPFQMESNMDIYTNPYNQNKVTTNIDFRFQTLDLLVKRFILGDQESGGQLYGGAGASWTLVTYKERYVQPAMANPMWPLENSQGRSISLNGMLGGEYKLGTIVLYGETMYSIPTRKWYIKNNFNIFTPRLSFQLGIRLPLSR